MKPIRKSGRGLGHLITQSVLILLLSGMAAAGHAQSVQYTEAFWRAQIRKVRLGMQQYQVEQFLPARSEGKQDFAADGASYTFTYALDAHWSVAVGYDRSGFHEKNNPYMTMGFPNDKVIVLPRLLKAENTVDETRFPQKKPRKR
jgi:hypothetical protein